VIVGSVKKSIAAMAPVISRKASQRLAGSGFSAFAFIHGKSFVPTYRTEAGEARLWMRPARPRWILGHHSEDQTLDCSWCQLSAMGFLTLEIIFTIQPEAGPMPPDHRFRGDDDKGLLPTRPDSRALPEEACRTCQDLASVNRPGVAISWRQHHRPLVNRNTSFMVKLRGAWYSSWVSFQAHTEQHLADCQWRSFDQNIRILRPGNNGGLLYPRKSAEPSPLCKACYTR